MYDNAITRKGPQPQPAEQSRHLQMAAMIGKEIVELEPGEIYELVEKIRELARVELHSRSKQLAEKIEGEKKQMESIQQFILNI